MVCAQQEQWRETNTRSILGHSRLASVRRRRTGHCMVLGVVLELLGRHGGTEEVLEVLQHILLAGRKGARLGVRFELVAGCHGYLSWGGVQSVSGPRGLAGSRKLRPYHVRGKRVL